MMFLHPYNELFIKTSPFGIHLRVRKSFPFLCVNFTFVSNEYKILITNLKWHFFFSPQCQLYCRSRNIFSFGRCSGDLATETIAGFVKPGVYYIFRKEKHLCRGSRCENVLLSVACDLSCENRQGEVQLFPSEEPRDGTFSSHRSSLKHLCLSGNGASQRYLNLYCTMSFVFDWEGVSGCQTAFFFLHVCTSA